MIQGPQTAMTNQTPSDARNPPGRSALSRAEPIAPVAKMVQVAFRLAGFPRLEIRRHERRQATSVDGTVVRGVFDPHAALARFAFDEGDVGRRRQMDARGKARGN